MKRFILVVLCVFVFILSGCWEMMDRIIEPTSKTTSTTITDTSTNLSTEGTTTEETTRAPASTPKPTKKPTPEPTTTVKVGSRLSPAPIDTPMVLVSTTDEDSLEISVVITKVIRGDKAKKMVMDENQFNEIPKGKEVLLAWVEVSLTKYKPEDENEAFNVSSWDFDFYDSKYTEIDSETLVIPEELDADMFEGGSTDGYIYVLVDPDDTPIARFSDVAWFALD